MKCPSVLVFGEMVGALCAVFTLLLSLQNQEVSAAAGYFKKLSSEELVSQISYRVLLLKALDEIGPNFEKNIPDQKTLQLENYATMLKTLKQGKDRKGPRFHSSRDVHMEGQVDPLLPPPKRGSSILKKIKNYWMKKIWNMNYPEAPVVPGPKNMRQSFPPVPPTPPFVPSTPVDAAPSETINLEEAWTQMSNSVKNIAMPKPKGILNVFRNLLPKYSAYMKLHSGEPRPVPPPRPQPMHQPPEDFGEIDHVENPHSYVPSIPEFHMPAKNVIVNGAHATVSESPHQPFYSAPVQQNYAKTYPSHPWPPPPRITFPESVPHATHGNFYTSYNDIHHNVVTKDMDGNVEEHPIENKFIESMIRDIL